MSVERTPTSPTSDAPTRRADEWFTRGRFALVLAALLFATFPGVFLGTGAFFYRDYGFLGYPFVFYARECFWNGELPMWNPYVNCGAPFLAQWNTLALYPGSLIYLLMPLPWSLGIFCVAHWLLGGMGMYALAQRWTQSRFAASVAGVAFVFSGASLTSHIYPNYLVTFGWMPWVVLLVERACREGGRNIVLAALAGAMQMLSGAPELILMTWAFAAALALTEVQSSKLKVQGFQNVLGRFALVVLLVAGLAAIQLLPFFDLLAVSQRAKNFGGGELGAGFWSLPTWGWANFFVPLFHCFKTPQGIYVQAGQSFLPSYYAGLAVLALGALAMWRVRERRVWILAAATAVCVLLAMGENAFLLPLLRAVLPLELMRFPVKFLLPVAFTLPLLAAFALGEVQSPKFKVQSWLVLSGVFAALVALVLAWARASALRTDDWTATTENAGVRVLCFALAMAGVWLAAKQDRAQMRFALQFGVLALLWLDLITHSPRQNPTIPPDAFAPGLVQAYHKFERPPRGGESRVMLSPRAEREMFTRMVPDFKNDFLGQRVALWGNLNILDDLPKVNGATTLVSRESAEVNALLYGATNEFPRLMDFLAVSHVTAPDEVMKFAARTGHLVWATAGQRPVFADAATTMRALASSDFKPGEEVFLPLDARPFITATNATHAKIVKANFSTRRVELEVEAAEPALLVIAQCWYPSWRAEVDGKPVQIWRANHAFQALEAPAGAKRVLLEYRERRLGAGAAITLGTLLVCAGIWFRKLGRTDGSL